MTCANYKHHDGHVSSDLRSLVGHRRRLRRSGRCDSPDEENRLAEGRVVALDPATSAQKALWVSVPGPDTWAASGAGAACRSSRTRAPSRSWSAAGDRGGVTAFRVGAGCTFVPVWRTVVGAGTQPPPVVVGDMLFAVGGYGRLCRARRSQRQDPLVVPDHGADARAVDRIGNLVVTADHAGTVLVFGPPSLRGGWLGV